MPRYRFSETVVYKSGDPWTTYEAGQEYDLTADHGDRWVRRGVAVRVDDAVLVVPEPVVEQISTGAATVNKARESLGMEELPVPSTPRFVRGQGRRQ